MRNINNNQFPAEQLAGVAGITITHMLIVAIVLVLGGLVFSAIRRTYDLRLRLRQPTDDLTTSWVRVWAWWLGWASGQLWGWGVWLVMMDDDRAHNKQERREKIIQQTEELRVEMDRVRCGWVGVDQELFDGGMKFQLDADWWMRDKGETVIAEDEDTIIGRIPTPPTMQEIPRTDQRHPLHKSKYTGVPQADPVWNCGKPCTGSNIDAPMCCPQCGASKRVYSAPATTDPSIHYHVSETINNGFKRLFDEYSKSHNTIIAKYYTRNMCVAEIFHTSEHHHYGLVGGIEAAWGVGSGDVVWIGFQDKYSVQDVKQLALMSHIKEGDRV